MAGAFAASLGAIAMAVVLLHGMLAGVATVECIVSAIKTMVAMGILGWFSGAILDYLVCQDLEQKYRRRVDWFRTETQAIYDEQANAKKKKLSKLPKP